MVFHAFQEGKKNHEALLVAKEWSEALGHEDKNNRRYFPTPKDISYLREVFTRFVVVANHKAQCHGFIFYRQKHLDPNDALSCSRLLKTDLQDQTLFFQPLHSDKQPLIIVLQNEEQRALFSECGTNLAFVDASYSGNNMHY